MSEERDWLEQTLYRGWETHQPTCKEVVKDTSSNFRATCITLLALLTAIELSIDKGQLLNSLQWLIYIFNSVDNTKLHCYTLLLSSTTVSVKIYPLYCCVSDLLPTSTNIVNRLQKRRMHLERWTARNTSHHAQKKWTAPKHCQISQPHHERTWTSKGVKHWTQ